MTSPTQTATLPGGHWHKPDLLRAMKEAAGGSPAALRFTARLTADLRQHPEKVAPAQCKEMLERALGVPDQEPHRGGDDGDLRRYHESNCDACHELFKRLEGEQVAVWYRICEAIDDLVPEYEKRVYPDGENCTICGLGDDRG